MAAPFYPAGVHAAAGSSPSVTSESSGSVSGNSASFPKSARLLKRASFEKVYATGTRLGCAYFSVICLSDPSFGCAKAGLTTPRRLGNSVARSRLKRKMREAIRHEIGRVKGSWGFVFHPRNAAADAPPDRLRAEVEKVFRKCS